jgi:hypothetical protein
MSLLYLLLPTQESYYLDKAVQRLFEETNVSAQKSLLSLLASTVTRRGDEALAHFAADAAKPEESRKYAQEIMRATEEMRIGTEPSLSTYESLKEDQRKLFRVVAMKPFRHGSRCARSFVAKARNSPCVTLES